MVEGAFSCSEEPSGDSHTPPICCKQLDLAAGGVWGLALPAQGLPGSGLGGSACCILHVWGCLWGTPWGMSPARCRGSCCDLPCSKLDSVWGGDMPTCQGHAMCLAGLGNAPYLHSQSVTWGGGDTAQLGGKAPLLCIPRLLAQDSSASPSPHAWGPAAAVRGGPLGPPIALAGVCTPMDSSLWLGGWLGPAPRCAGLGRTGPSGQIRVSHSPLIPLPSCFQLFSITGAVRDRVGSVPSAVPLPWLSHTPSSAICPWGGGAASVVPPPTPALMPWWGGYSFWWVLQIMVLSTLDSLLF